MKSGWNPAPSSSIAATVPPSSTVPALGGMIPARSLSSVLLPDPLLDHAIALLGATSSEMSCTAQKTSDRVRRRRRTVSLRVALRSCMSLKLRDTPRRRT